MANNISNHINEKRSTLSSFLPNKDDRWVKWSAKLCGWFLAVITVIPAFSIVAFAKASDALKKRKLTPYNPKMNPFSEEYEHGEADLNPSGDQLPAGNPLDEAAEQSETMEQQKIVDTNHFAEDEASQSVKADTQGLMDEGVQSCDACVQTTPEQTSEQSNELSREIEYLSKQVNDLSKKVLNLEQENVDLKKEIQELKESAQSKPSSPWDKSQKTTAERAESSSNNPSKRVAASQVEQPTADQESQKNVDLKKEIQELKESAQSKPSSPWDKSQKTTAERAESSSNNPSKRVAASQVEQPTADQESQKNVDLKKEIQELKESAQSKPSFPWDKSKKTTAERAESSSRKHPKMMAASQVEQPIPDQESHKKKIRDLVHSYKRIRVDEGDSPKDFCKKLSSLFFSAILKNKKVIKSYRINASGKNANLETSPIDRSVLNELLFHLSENPKNFRRKLKDFKTEIGILTSPEAKQVFKQFLTESGVSTEETKFKNMTDRFISILLGLYTSGTEGKNREGIPPLVSILDEVKSSLETRIAKRAKKGMEEPLP